MSQPARLPPEVVEAFAELLARDYFRRKAEAAPDAEANARKIFQGSSEAEDPEVEK